MKYLIPLILSNITALQTIFNFNNKTDYTTWAVTNDVVMGGKSSGYFKLSAQGHGIFYGNVSTDNNGGFSSVRHKLQHPIKTTDHTKVVLTLKGDKKVYQFRIKAQSKEYFSYICKFSTTGDWQKIEIELKDMYPAFRGKKLSTPNFCKDEIQEIAFLIGNKKNEAFKLLIDKIELK